MITPFAEFSQNLEADLLNCHLLLRDGLESATEKFEDSRSKLDATVGATIQRLRDLELDADGGINRIQRRLGEMNLLLTCEDLHSLEQFDRYASRVIAAMHEALAEIEELEFRTDEVVGSSIGRLSEAWRRFRPKLEMVRLHLTLGEKYAEDELKEQRNQFAEHLRKAHHEYRADRGTLPRALKRLVAEAKQIGGDVADALQTFFLLKH